MRRLFAALALVVAAPGATQSTTGQATTRAELLAPNEDARVFFERLPSHILTGDVMAGLPEERTRPFDQLIERTLARGERVPNWQNSGADLLAIVSAKAGGLAGNVVTEPGELGPTLTYFVGGPIEPFVPPGWVLIARRGETAGGDNVQIQLTHLSPKVLVAERVDLRRVGNAICRIRAETRLYSDPSIPASEMDLAAVLVALRYLPAMDQRGLCEIAEESAPGEYVFHNFDAEGYRLPAMDAASRPFQILPIVHGSAQPSSR